MNDFDLLESINRIQKLQIRQEELITQLCRSLKAYQNLSLGIYEQLDAEIKNARKNFFKLEKNCQSLELVD